MGNQVAAPGGRCQGPLWNSPAIPALFQVHTEEGQPISLVTLEREKLKSIPCDKDGIVYPIW